MGYAENRKLAKDINIVNTECADNLGSLMRQMSSQINIANKTLEGIASQETRTVYKPSLSEEDIVLQPQSANISVFGQYEGRMAESEKTVTLGNVFQAKHNGDVTLYISGTYKNGCRVYATYTLIQKYQGIETIILSGVLVNSPYNSAGSTSPVQENFSVIEGAIYSIKIYLYVEANHGQSSSINTTTSIRAIEETITGTQTQYYYPAEGAPVIWSDNTSHTFTDTGTILSKFFTPECDGAAIIKFKVKGSSVTKTVSFSVRCGENSWSFKSPSITSSNTEISYSICLEKGMPCSLSFSLSGSDSEFSITVSDISISAVKTSNLPIVVPFIPLKEPLAVTSNKYIIKKMPQVPAASYAFVVNGSVYPKILDNKYMSMYDIANGRADFSARNDDGDHKMYKSGKPSTSFANAANYTVYCGMIEGELCIYATGESKYIETSLGGSFAATLY